MPENEGRREGKKVIKRKNERKKGDRQEMREGGTMIGDKKEGRREGKKAIKMTDVRSRKIGKK